MRVHARGRWCATHLFQLHFVILETAGTFISPVCILCFIYYLFFENRTWLQLLYHLHAASKTQQLHTRCIWFLSPLISLLFLPFMIKRPENKQHADLQPYNELWGEKKNSWSCCLSWKIVFIFVTSIGCSVGSRSAGGSVMPGKMCDRVSRVERELGIIALANWKQSRVFPSIFLNWVK